jgi:hypothetical protein
VRRGALYNEDGNCLASGNDISKAHRPECQIADLIDEVERLRIENGKLKRHDDGQESLSHNLSTERDELKKQEVE